MTPRQEALCKEYGAKDLSEALAACLRETDYNAYQAAMRAGVSYFTFRKWMKQAGLRVQKRVVKEK